MLYGIMSAKGCADQLMGIARSPLPVKLFVGMLTAEKALFDEIAEACSSAYGPIDATSDIFAWNRSDYYQDELGAGIVRKFLFFEQLADPSILPSMKHFTNKLENSYAVKNGPAMKRRINLDPGYITEAKVVLASTKDFAHRIYIGGGIYAEVTLRYAAKERSFEPLVHTYPDFREKTHIQLFNVSRRSLRTTLQVSAQKR